MVDAEKRFETREASIVKTDKTGKDTVPMFRDATKRPRLASATKVTAVASEKKFVVRANGKANRFNPQITGANKLSLQKFNTYAYRKSNSSQPGVPVKKAAGADISPVTSH